MKQRIEKQKRLSIFRNLVIALFIGAVFLGKNYFVDYSLRAMIILSATIVAASFLVLHITDPWYEHLKRRERVLEERERRKVIFRHVDLARMTKARDICRNSVYGLSTVKFGNPLKDSRKEKTNEH